MNTLKANITDIHTSGSLSLVSLQSGNQSLKSIVIDTPDTAAYLQVGEEVNIIFKEMEVSIATEEQLPISLQNRIYGTISTIDRSDLLSRVVLSTDLGQITSVITTASVDRLELQPGQKVFALIKTNELMLSKE
ncbi:TOBE domain-containing protein [Roseivirga sp.]|uniref:TOBE domain-containing protein n=1 Tax=Roseivirga sp. TaxID=1964215 RepID=UPI003B51C4E8